MAETRGLPFRHDVKVQVETPELMRLHMEREIAEHLDEATQLGLNTTWSALGLVGDDFDVATAYADILEQHVGGYFDVKNERLVLVHRIPGGQVGSPMQDMVTSHELVHALQDQHFDLWQFTQRELHNDDVSAALQALVEGDATYAMLYRLPANVDPDTLPTDQLLRMMGSAGGPSDDMGGALGSSPRVLRVPLVFPYTHGLAFAQKVKLSGTAWTAMDQAFVTPPLSTEQVLHPQKYVGSTPDWPTLLEGLDPSGLLGEGWSLVSQDTFGELGMRILFEEHLPAKNQPDASAIGWGGDRMWVWHDASRDKAAVMWVSTWDDEAAAEAHGQRMQQVLRRLRPDAEWNGTRGRQDHAVHSVSQRRDTVIVLLDVPKSSARGLSRYARSLDRRTAQTLDDVAPPPTKPRRSP